MRRGIMIGLLILSSTASSYAQASRQLKVEAGPSNEIWITASGVTYGEVLRALQEKLECEIEIPPAADEQMLSYLKVEDKQPQDAFAELFAGSKLGYAYLGGNGSPITKLIVTRFGNEPASSAPNPTVAQAGRGDSAPPSAQPQTELMPQSAPPEKLSLANAVNSMGTPSGVIPASVGLQTTFSMADVASVMGVPPGVRPSDVGQAKVFPLSEAASVIGVAPGTAPDSVGKTITMPLPSASDQRP